MTAKSSVAGVYAYMVGAGGHTDADVAAANAMEALEPGIGRSFAENLSHNGRRVRDLTARGFRRFLDIGAGIMIDDRNTCSVAAESGEPVRIVCVDYDDEAVSRGRATFAGRDDARYIKGDLRRVDELLAAPEVADLLDGPEPVAVLLFTVVHYLDDHDHPADVLRKLRDAAPQGSVVVLSQAVPADTPAERQETVDAGFAEAHPLTLRTPAQILALAEVWGPPEPPVFVGEWGVPEADAATAQRWVLTTSATKQG